MKRPTLLRRREVWVPTIWGWLALLLIAAATIVLGGRSLHTALALNEPVGARILAVEGWMGPEELDQAVAAFHARGYEQVVTTGGPIPGRTFAPIVVPPTFADRAADYLKSRGIPATQVTAVPAPETARDRTFESAVMVREWAKRSGVDLQAIDVMSYGPHARRSRLLYRLALGPDSRVGVLAASARDYDPKSWWRTSAGTKEILEELIGLAWVECCFWPPAPDQR